MLGLAISLSACVQAPFVPPLGAISSVQAPLDLDADNTNISDKKGSASAVTILGLISVGDVSYETAARNGRISVIKYSDYDYLNVLGLFQKTTVNVYGE